MDIKKLVAYVPCQITFYLGHWVSKPMYDRDWFWLYRLYNVLMGWSCSLSLWAKLPYWRKQKEHEDEMF